MTVAVLLALVITVAVEVPIVALVFAGQRRRMAIVAAVTTGITNLLMNTLLRQTVADNLTFLHLGELGALVIEAGVYFLASKPREPGRAIAASALANATSYLVGRWATRLLPASANSPAPDVSTYRAEVSGNEVAICPHSYHGPIDFPAGAVMLRRDVTTGEVFELDGNLDAEGCFVDSCVAQGSYEYGLADPYSCIGMDTIYLYDEVVVEQALDPTCEQSRNDHPAQPSDAAVPWSTGVSSVDCNDGTASNYGNGFGGCTVAGLPSSLWGPYAAALVAGLALMGASRRRKRRH